MNKIFYKYLFTALSRTLLFSLFGCTFLLLVDSLSEIIQSVVLRHVPFLKVLEILSYDMIYLLTLSIPMAVMLGVLITYSNLANSNEIIAFESLGISLFQTITPALILGSFFTLLSLFINQFFSPVAYKRHMNVIKEIAYSKPSVNIEEKRFISGLSNYSIYVDKYSSRKSQSGNFIVFQKNSKFDNIIFGKSLQWNKGELVLNNSKVYELDKDGNISSRVNFEKQHISLRDVISDFSELGLGDEINYLSFTDLYRKMKATNSIYFEMLITWKLALCFSPFILAILAALLSLKANVRLGKRDNLALGIVLLFFYWLWLTYAKGLEYDEKIRPYMILWLPNLFFSVLSILLYFKRRVLV